MKKYILISITILFCQFLKAQDTILKFNGEKIAAKITEITTTEVKYKKIDFLDGPLYILNKSDIQLIKYANGLKEEFQVQQPKDQQILQSANDYYGKPAPSNNKIEMYGYRYRYQGYNINERKLHTILLQSKDKQIISLVGKSKDAHGLEFIGFVAIPLGIAAGYFFLMSNSTLGTGTGANSVNSSYLTGAGLCLVGSIACPIASGVFRHNRADYNRQAVKLYNEKY